MIWIFNILLFCMFIIISYSYKHVVIMHGVNDGPAVFSELKRNIEKAHPGTNVTLLDVDNNKYSLIRQMWYQVEDIKKLVVPIMEANPDGVHLIGYSQGGLLFRGFLESYGNHTVHNFIAISSPQAGQYGDTDKFRYFFPVHLKKEMYRFFYSGLGQHFSIGNYWNDPHQQSLYLEYSNYLAVINNQSHNNLSHAYKANFVKIKNLVMIGGPDDGVITPWQSSHFGAYGENETVIEMRDQEWYKQDWFGLQTLDKRGALHTYIEPHLKHHDWIINSTIFHKYIEPWLT